MPKKANRRRASLSSPPWYGFKVNLAIVALSGYCGTLDTAAKEILKRNCGAELAPFWR